MTQKLAKDNCMTAANLDFTVLNRSLVARCDKVARDHSILSARLKTLKFYEKIISDPNTIFDTSLPESVWRRRVRQEKKKIVGALRLLESNNPIDHTKLYPCLGATKSQFVKAVFGRDLIKLSPRKPDGSFEDVMLERFREGSVNARRAEMVFRLREELSQAARLGWFVVFNTLTVEDWSYRRVFSEKSSAFRNYIRAVNRYVLASRYGSIRKGLEHEDIDEVARYFAVVEEGEQTGRLHIHVLHFFKYLPDKWMDPNIGSGVPENISVNWFNDFWQFGFTYSRPVRWNGFDVWAKKGWRWPVVNGERMKAYPLGSLAGYMAKYVTKSKQLIGDYEWRTRMTRKFGTIRIRQVISRLSVNELLIALELPRIRIETVNGRIPQYLLRVIILTTYLRKLSRNGLRKQIVSNWMDLLERPLGIKERLGLLKLGKITSMRSSLTSFTSLHLRSLPDEGVFKVVRLKLFALFEENFLGSVDVGGSEEVSCA